MVTRATPYTHPSPSLSPSAKGGHTTWHFPASRVVAYITFMARTQLIIASQIFFGGNARAFIVELSDASNRTRSLYTQHHEDASASGPCSVLYSPLFSFFLLRHQDHTTGFNYIPSSPVHPSARGRQWPAIQVARECTDCERILY